MNTKGQLQRSTIISIILILMVIIVLLAFNTDIFNKILNIFDLL